MQEEIKDLEIQLRKLEQLEATHIELQKEFRGLIDSTLDGYNEGWLPKSLMSLWVDLGNNKLRAIEADLINLAKCQKETRELIEKLNGSDYYDSTGY